MTAARLALLLDPLAPIAITLLARGRLGRYRTGAGGMTTYRYIALAELAAPILLTALVVLVRVAA